MSTQEPADSDRAETQRFTIFTTLLGHHGHVLTAALVEQITEELVREMQSGGTAWAFAKGAGGAS